MKKPDPSVKIHVLPGGIMPVRQTAGAIGYDASVRAVVSPTEMDPTDKRLRKTLFDFQTMPDDPIVAGHIQEVPCRVGGGRELIYRMRPYEMVLVGIGFATEMPYPMFYWVAPRSGLASRYGITVANAPGTVDPDYRGEAGAVIINMRDQHFDLRHGMRIVQVIFQWAVTPEITEVGSLDDLTDTLRAAGGFGSTGLVTPTKNQVPST